MNNILKSDENNSGIKLIIWIIFIVIIFVMFKTTNKNDKKEELVKEEQQTFINYPDMIDNLLTNGYDYKYIITNDTTKEIYEGSNCDNIEIGYKETIDTIIKYKIENGISKKIIVDTEEETENIYNGFRDYLNINNLFNNLKEYLYSINKENETRTISYKKDDYQVIVKTNLEYITNITITTSTYNYDLEFTNVGKCANINHNK